jgi:photosystem II stability/assembly factor-like uncharacterized protein
MTARHLFCVTLFLGVATAGASPALAQRSQTRARAQGAAVAQPQIDPALYANLEYRYIGPVGNRTIAVAGVPGNPNVYYTGAASGGIFKTVDGGIHWTPIFDDEPVSSVGALAVAASDPSIVWAGTGESFIRSHISLGWGVYKSVDAGKTWKLMGLENTGRIARVVINPYNPDVVYVCALGHAYGPQADRGVFRTLDGGKTWDKVLFVDENSGCSDLAMDPNNPQVLFAGTWQIEIHTWGRESGGPGSGLWESRDGGGTWKRLTGHGLPLKPIGKVGLAIARTNSNHIYALIETGDGVPEHGKATDSGELWASEDGGATWALVSYDRQLAGRTHYYNRVVVSPDDENEAYFLAAAFSKTLDGGTTTIDVPFNQYPGGDNHDMWIDPTNANRMIVANDGNVSISTTRGASWLRQQLPIGQMYHVEVDNQVPYYVYGNRQDGPSFRGPSNSKGGGFRGPGAITRAEWHSIGGGESGWATPDPVDPNIIWSTASGSGSRGGIVVRFDERTRTFRNVEVWPQTTGGWPAADLKYRFVWDAPFLISPHDHNEIYIGSQYLHVSTDGGSSWKVISPDLTLNDKSRQQASGGLTLDDIGVEYAGTVYAIAESPLKAGLIWVGTNDGLVQVTQDHGAHWTNVTANIPNLPPWGSVRSIEPSHFDTATAYVTVDFHQVNNRDPFVYKTTDFGKSWKPITDGIAKSPLSYVHIIREDPFRRGLLFLGTENALYVSFNDGGVWQPLQNNLPHAPVYGLVIQKTFHDLVVATYGRGFWIMDDITPLEQLTPDVMSADAQLLPPREVYRFRPVANNVGPTDDQTAGQNPPFGAAINYWLKGTMQGDVSIAIDDGTGNTVRRLRGTKQAGLNRVVWDLRDEPTRQARMRVHPEYAAWVEVPPEGRPMPSVSRISILQPPGSYRVKLTVGGHEYTQPLHVLKDPGSGGSEQEIQQQVALLKEIKSDQDTVAGMLNTVELVRYQLQTLERVLVADKAAADIRAATDSLEHQFRDFEGHLQQIMITGRGQDGIRYPSMLIQQLDYLNSVVSEGDFAPTTQDQAVYQLLDQQTHTYVGGLAQLLSQDLARFNAMLQQRGIGNVVVGK